jgi:hypothetical protein
LKDFVKKYDWQFKLDTKTRASSTVIRELLYVICQNLLPVCESQIPGLCPSASTVFVAAIAAAATHATA